MSMTSEWTTKLSSKSEETANYTALSGNLKKAHSRKQKSGRGSGKVKIHREVVNEKEIKCFACKRPGHKMAGCHDKKSKAAWISEREAKNQSKRDYDNEDNREGRKKHRDRNERCDLRVEILLIVRRKRKRISLILGTATTG